MMNHGKVLLSSLVKTSRIGQIHIRSVLDTGMASALRTVLEHQLKEYSAIESEANTIAFQRGWELPEQDAAIRFLLDRRNRLRLTGKHTDSRIADLMIRENTGGMIRNLQQLNRMEDEDIRLRVLFQKLLDCETACIRQMQRFL